METRPKTVSLVTGALVNVMVYFVLSIFFLRVPQNFMLEDVMKAVTAVYTSSGADSLLRMCPRSMEMKEVAIEEGIVEQFRFWRMQSS